MEVWKNSVCPVSSLVLCMSRFVKARSSRCIIGKAFSMCQKNLGVEKVMFSGPYGILRQWSVSCRWSLQVFALLLGSCLIWGASCPSWRMALSTMCPFGPNLPQHDCTLEGLCQEIPSCIFSKHKIHRFLKCRQVLRDRFLVCSQPTSQLCSSEPGTRWGKQASYATHWLVIDTKC